MEFGAIMFQFLGTWDKEVKKNNKAFILTMFLAFEQYMPAIKNGINNKTTKNLE
jgi:hypothetical protein